MAFSSCRHAVLHIESPRHKPFEGWLVRGAQVNRVLGSSLSVPFSWHPDVFMPWILVFTDPTTEPLPLAWHHPRGCSTPERKPDWQWDDMERDAWWLVSAWGLSLSAFHTGLFVDIWNKYPFWGMAWQTVFMVVTAPVRRHLSLTSYLVASLGSLAIAWILAFTAFKSLLQVHTLLQGAFFSALFGLSLAVDWGVPVPIHSVQCT
jgi:hypothetical protein